MRAKREDMRRIKYASEMERHVKALVLVWSPESYVVRSFSLGISGLRIFLIFWVVFGVKQSIVMVH